MQTHRLRNLILAVAFLAHTLRAADFTIDCWTVKGGGGASTNGTYAVTGTIGQPDAGQMSGGSYTLRGGFRGLVAAAQTTGAPTLAIQKTTTNTIVISWASPSNGFSLEQSDDLRASAWAPPAETVADNGTKKFIIINPPGRSRFYRLVHL